MKVIIDGYEVDTKKIDRIGEIYSDDNFHFFKSEQINPYQPKTSFVIHFFNRKDIEIFMTYNRYLQKYKLDHVEQKSDEEFQKIINIMKHDLRILRENVKELWLSDPCKLEKINF